MTLNPTGNRTDFLVSAKDLSELGEQGNFQQLISNRSYILLESESLNENLGGKKEELVVEQKGSPVSNTLKRGTIEPHELITVKKPVDLYDNEHMPLVLIVHEAFLESGFVGFDSVSRKQIGFQIPEEWPFKAFTVQYTPSKLLGEGVDNVAADDYVSVKFQSCGHLVNVYGCLNNISDQVYHLCLNGQVLCWENYDHMIKRWRVGEGTSVLYREEFWKIVKDELVYSLLIDLCYKTGLALPGDLKLSILESLPGSDIAKMECVCNEMRSLSSRNDNLWKQKYEKESSSWIFYPIYDLLKLVEAETCINWKFQFSKSWSTRSPVYSTSCYPFYYTPTSPAYSPTSPGYAGRRFSSSHHDCNEQLIFMVDEIFSGFGLVRFDSVFRNQIGFQIPEEWPAKAFTVQYTHSKLLCNDDDEVVVADYVSVRFQRCGHLVNVYGCLNNSSSEVYHMCLNGPREMWENYDNKMKWRIIYSESWKSNPKDFRKNVKDKLAFPLLIDVCYSSGMDLPSCFMTLPADLKVKILESLRGADIAKMECVCKEMQSLSLSSPANFLWKQKFEEEITFLAGINFEEEEAEAEIGWRLLFANGYGFLRLLHCPSYPAPPARAHARALARSGRYNNNNNYASHPRPWDFRWDFRWDL